MHIQHTIPYFEICLFENIKKDSEKYLGTVDTSKKFLTDFWLSFPNVLNSF